MRANANEAHVRRVCGVWRALQSINSTRVEREEKTVRAGHQFEHKYEHTYKYAQEYEQEYEQEQEQEHEYLGLVAHAAAPAHHQLALELLLQLLRRHPARAQETAHEVVLHAPSVGQLADQIIISLRIHIWF